jgi:uncharacterized protein
VSLTNRLSACFSFSPWLERILKHPRKVISGISVITLFFAWHVFHLSFATSVYDLVIENIPETVQYNEFKKLFGSDEIIRIVVKGADVFEAGTFEKVTRISEEALRIKGVRRIISLPEIRKGIDISGRLSLEEFVNRIRPVELFRKNLISDDARSTSLTLVMSEDADRHVVIEAINHLLERESQGLATYQIGIPLVSDALSSLTKKDFCRLPPVSMLLFAGILFLLYRHVNCIVVPLLCVIVALIWTFGLMSICKIPLSMLTMMVPIFLLAIGIAYCLHICSEYLAFSRTSRNPTEVVRLTFSSIAFPTFLTVLTTVIGFASLWVNRITAIQEFAFFSSFGMISILMVLFTLFPAVLSLLPPPSSSTTRVNHFFDRLIQQIIRLNLNRQYVTLPIIAVISLFCLAGIFRIEVETNPMGYLKPDSPVSRNFHDIYQDLSGSFPLNVVMESSDANYFQNPSHIRQILDLQKTLATISGVDKTVSFADYLMLVNYVINRFDPGYYAIPDDAIEVRMLVNNYKMLLGDDMLKRFMSPDFSNANVLLFTHIASSNGFLAARDQILNQARDILPSAMGCSVTGIGMAIASSSRLLTHGQVKSLSLTLAIIFGLMLMMFMSAKVGGISILPNLLPIVVNFGLMGWLGIELSLVTSLIASIAIGLAVDDTIHYLVRYNRKFKDLLDKKRSLEKTLRHVGSPMIYTTVTICAGFSILAFSSFQPTATLGILMVIIMISALVGDILLLPALMLHVELVTLWDLVRVKMGKDPQEGIPLFSGLRKGQVRAMMASGALKNIGPGQILFNKGDPSDFMYAIVSGSFDVVDPPDTCGGNSGLCKRIVQLRAGDVVGEMGFFRSAPRSATIVATEEGSLFLISWKILSRLQWLYPPIAHKFFHNLMRMMCDRLDISTQRLSSLKCMDDLTGLCNRSEFEKIVDIEMNRSRRYGSTLVICMVRLFFSAPEDWKQENCSLKRIEAAAHQLSRQLRKCDTVCRYDVHTFSILMPETDLDSAFGVCARLREVIRAEACDEMPFATAHGIATPSGQSDGPSSLLSRAEATLSLT